MSSSRISRSRIFAAALGLLAIATPLVNADNWFRIDFGVKSRAPRHAHPRPVILPPPLPPVIHYPHKPHVPHRHAEVFPRDLQITAYQSGDTIIVVARGSNATAGFTTCLTAADVRGHSVELTLYNTAPHGFAAQVISPFEVNGAVRCVRPISSIKVHVAGRSLSIPITRVANL